MMTQDYNDATIAAISTPPGPGGIGIIRISGGHALRILHTLFEPRNPLQSFDSHKMYYGCVVNSESREPIDEVLAVYMRSPHTYTREDVVEIHCHGSYIVLQEILSQILSTNEARLAEPGEFTKRAFLNGRIDLTQAEAVAELLQAKTREGLNLAVAQLQGGLHNKIINIRDTLLSIRAIIEVAIDFPEDDVDILDPAEMLAKSHKGVKEPVKQLIASSQQGKILREGISVVILGRPNVGKSSLLNSLLKEERAIVTAVPGTTRDTIEEYLDIKGIPVKIVDTAGIRESSETVEEIGIKKARQKIESADIILFMVDASEALTEDDHALYRAVANRSLIVVVNKMDIADKVDLHEYNRAFSGHPAVAISAKENQGLEALESAIFDVVTVGMPPWDPGCASVPNLRHKAALKNALAATERFEDGVRRGLPPDLLAIELQTALDCLGDIVGETTTEDVLDMIFEQFCIGK